MGAKSNIEWTDASWNPVTGCTKVSQGCKNCYAETWANRHLGEFSKDRARKFTDIICHEDKLDLPLRWKRPRMVFVNSMSDLFHEYVPFEFIDAVFARMAVCKEHTFQILTKRPELMVAYMKRAFDSGPGVVCVNLTRDGNRVLSSHDKGYAWPLPNVWLGVSCEDQATADERIPLLLQSPATVRFVSCEPLLGPIDLMRYHNRPHPALDWVIIGGESGPHARPMHPIWAQGVRDQCGYANVPFFFKQWGEWIGTEVYIETEENTYEVMEAPNGYDYTSPLEGKFADRPGRFRIPQHRWDADTRSLRVGKKEAGSLLDGVEWKQFPKEKA